MKKLWCQYHLTYDQTRYVAKEVQGGQSLSISPSGMYSFRSLFAIACRQVGPITVNFAELPKKAEVFSQRTSLICKETQVVPMVDLTHRPLVYLAYSTRVVEEPPASTVSRQSL